MKRFPRFLFYFAWCGIASFVATTVACGQQGTGGQGTGGQGQAAEQRQSQFEAQMLLNRGVERLSAGEIEQALADLDRVVELSPASEPYLWQRGIAQYFAGKYQEGRKQFESHRKVNPNDVENATWHFLCVAATDGVQQAREAMLPAPNDSRVPQEEIYKLFKGTGTIEDVDRAVNKLPESSRARQVARFYADLYIGLLAHAEGRAEDAKKYLTAAGNTPDEGVMADVARLCRDRLIR